VALTPPDVSDLEQLKLTTFDDDEYLVAEIMIQMATDLFWMATGLDADPTDEREARIVRYGILDMAWYLGTSMEDRDASFSPFSSERIGSYSYSKAQSAVSLEGKTGVPLFDIAVAFWNDKYGTPSSSSVSTHVMPDTMVHHFWTTPPQDAVGFPDPQDAVMNIVRDPA